MTVGEAERTATGRIVAVEGVRGAGCRRIPGVATGEEEIGVEVTVEVEGQDAYAHGFGQELLAGGAVEVDEPDSRFVRDVPEGGAGWRRPRGGGMRGATRGVSRPFTGRWVGQTTGRRGNKADQD